MEKDWNFLKSKKFNNLASNLDQEPVPDPHRGTVKLLDTGPHRVRRGTETPFYTVCGSYINHKIKVAEILFSSACTVCGVQLDPP